MPFDRWLPRIAAAALIIAVIAAALLARSCAHERTAKAETQLATGQAVAAHQSGADAANTVGNRMTADAATDTITSENHDAITRAPGADQAVAPAARDAGLRGLCRYAAYRRDPRCVQHAGP